MQSRAGVAIGIAVIVAVAGGSAIFRHAWQEGWISPEVMAAHPRAPLAENFLSAIRNSAAAAQAVVPPCVRLRLRAHRDIDRMGPPGLEHRRVPGWDVVTVARAAGEVEPESDATLRALEALAKAELYAAHDSATQDRLGRTLPARSFTLTLEGWKRIGDEQCFRIGEVQVRSIAGFSRALPDAHGRRSYDVRARYALLDRAVWLDDPAIHAVAVADDIAALAKPVFASFRLVRTDAGWEVEPGEVLQLRVAQSTIMALATKGPGESAPRACITLPGPGRPQGVEFESNPHAVVFYANAVDSDARFRAHQLWKSRLGTLVDAGVFSERRFAADPAANVPEGTRFVLEPAYRKWLDPGDARCLRMGDVALEFFGLAQPARDRPASERVEPRANARFLARLARDAWITGVELPLPEVGAVKAAGGVPLVATLSRDAQAKAPAWALGPLEYPPFEPLPLPRPQAPFVLADAPLTGPIPSRDAESVARGDVTWQAPRSRASGAVSRGGLTARYCCEGARSMTLSSQPVAAGKVYAEFEFAARPRALHGDALTGIGVIPVVSAGADASAPASEALGAPAMAFAGGGEIGHRDVIGLAIDLDAGMLHVSRNGEWLGASPGSGAGKPLARGRGHHVAAFVAASPSSAWSDSWTANFGKAKFRYLPPRGYRSFDGRQRARA